MLVLDEPSPPEDVHQQSDDRQDDQNRDKHVVPPAYVVQRSNYVQTAIARKMPIANVHMRVAYLRRHRRLAKKASNASSSPKAGATITAHHRAPREPWRGTRRDASLTHRLSDTARHGGRCLPCTNRRALQIAGSQPPEQRHDQAPPAPEGARNRDAKPGSDQSGQDHTHWGPVPRSGE